MGMKYDVCIIGAGPAGYAAAMRALDLNKSVILIEKEKKYFDIINERLNVFENIK